MNKPTCPALPNVRATAIFRAVDVWAARLPAMAIAIRRRIDLVRCLRTRRSRLLEMPSPAPCRTVSSHPLP